MTTTEERIRKVASLGVIAEPGRTPNLARRAAAYRRWLKGDARAVAA